MTKQIDNNNLTGNQKQLQQFLTAIPEQDKFAMMQLYNSQPDDTKDRWAMVLQSTKLDFSLQKAALSVLHSTEFLDSIKPINALSAMSYECATLATLKVYQGEVVTNAILHKLIKELVDFFNLGGNMNSTQIQITSELIYEEYHYLKISEIKYCFRQGMKLKYGELYNRIDGQVILGWLDKFRAERAALAGSLSIETSRQQQEKAKGQFMSADILKQVQELRKNLDLKEQQRKLEQQSRFQYTTLEKYFEAHGVDKEEEMKRLRKEWLDLYQSDVENESYSFEVFCQIQKTRLLAEVNKSKITLKKTQERIDL